MSSCSVKVWAFQEIVPKAANIEKRYTWDRQGKWSPGLYVKQGITETGKDFQEKMLNSSQAPNHTNTANMGTSLNFSASQYTHVLWLSS